MIGSMGRSKTAALWAVGYQDIDPICKIGIIAWPEADDIMFDEVTADIIGDDGSAGCKSDPPPACFSVI